MTQTTDSTKKYMKEGASLLLDKKYEEAEKVYQQAIELQPNHPWINCNLGRSLLNQGKVEIAIPYLQKAIELDSNMAEAYYNLGNAFTKQNRFEEAENAYRKATELEPDRFLYHHQLGDAFFLQSKHEEAVSPYGKAIELNSEYAWSYHNLGRALSELERWSEAIAVYDQFLKLQPDSTEVEAQRQFAQQQLQGRRYQEEEISPQPNSVNDPWLQHHQHAEQLRAQHQLDEAIATYRHAIDVNPSHTPSYQNLGDALQERGLLDQAIAVYQEAVEFVESETTLNYLNGKIQQLEHQFQRMDDLLSKLSPSQLGLGEVIIDAEFPLTPMQGFFSQDYDQYGVPLRWTIPGKPVTFELFCDRTSPQEIEIRLVNQSIDNIKLYGLVENQIISLHQQPSEDDNYAIFTGVLFEAETRKSTRINIFAVPENEVLNLTELLTFLQDENKLISVPFSRFSLKALNPVIA
jgi:tetratricopeptide (TPR) repeat protein